MKRKKLLREWIIFALCLGLGAHVTLGFVLHAPWSLRTEVYGLYGILIGLFIYVLIQVGRSIWWIYMGNQSSQKPYGDSHE